ncbi:MAG: hypothetical protein GC188_09700 [Alphaproteobacteria bacterium]|nr:hypothetical protein [Alphaproteobacteria bacterium]
MTTNKLLTGVALAALLSGGALAQTVSNTVDAASSAALPGDGVAFVASEFQPAAAVDQLAGNIIILSRFDGAASPFSSIPVDGRVRLTISLTNATFTSASGATFTGNDGGNCSFEPSAVTGGGIGNSSVGFISTAADSISLCNNTVNGDVSNAAGAIGLFTIPVQRTASNAPVSVTLTYTQANNDGSSVANPVTVQDTLDFANLASAWDASGVAGDHQFTAGTELLATNAGILSAGTLGTVQVDFRNATADPLDIRAHGGAQIAVGDLFDAAGEIAITFPAGVGDVDGVSIAGIATPACAGPVADVFTCAIVAADITVLDGGPANITYTVGGGLTPPVTPEQTPTAVFTSDPAANYVAAGFSGNLAPITHDDGLREDTVGAAVGGADTYDWVRFGSGGTESNFRIQMASAADAAGITEVRVNVAAGNGVSGGVVTLVPGTADTGFVQQGSTITFNSRALGAASGESGNANITSIELQYQESVLGAGSGGPGTVKVEAATSQRQLVNRSPGSFVATPGLGNDG